MDSIQVTYSVRPSEFDIEDQARSILLEQTVETPDTVALQYPFVRENLMGSIANITPNVDGGFLVTLSIPSLVASQNVAQLLNVLFGNVSLHERVVLEDFDLPASTISMLRGPRFGINGLRDLLNVYDRPLTCSAIKPIGISHTEMACLCTRLVRGGIDLIKDDHYLSDYSFSPFEERVRTCRDAVEKAAAETGHRTIYAPHVSGTPDEIKRQVEFAQEEGIKAVLIAPMLIGLPTFYELATKYLEIPAITHPSFGGSIRIREHVLFGKLFRMLGADAVIFPNYGGRFSYPAALCDRIASTLRAPIGQIRPAFPVPAGGMKVDRVPELVQFFGKDAILLIGGSLLEAGERLTERTRDFVGAVTEASTQLV